MLPSFHVPAASTTSPRKLKERRKSQLRKSSCDMDSLERTKSRAESASFVADTTGSLDTSFEASGHDVDGPVSVDPAAVAAPVVEEGVTTAVDEVPDEKPKPEPQPKDEGEIESAQPGPSDPEPEPEPEPTSTTPPGSPPRPKPKTNTPPGSPPKPKSNPPTTTTTATTKPPLHVPVRYSLFPKIVDYPKFNLPTIGPITAESWARWGPQTHQNQGNRRLSQVQGQTTEQTPGQEQRNSEEERKEETGLRKVFPSHSGSEQGQEDVNQACNF